MKPNKKSKLFFRILFLFILVFVGLNIAYESGYYETKAKTRTTLTKEAMEQFETDLKNGQLIDVKDYIVHDQVDYSNSVTKIGNKLANGLSDILTNGLTGIFDCLKGLFW